MKRKKQAEVARMILFQYIFYIFLVFAFLIMLVFFYEEQKEKQRLKRQDPLDILYEHIWTGDAGDRLAAWDRVIVHLQSYHPDSGAILEAIRRKQALERRMSENLYVSDEGKLKAKKSYYHHK